MHDIPGALLHHFAVERSSEVTLWRHRIAVRFFANNFLLYRDTSSCKGWRILLACIVASQHTAPSQTGRRAARLSTAAHRPLARWPSTAQRRSAAVGPRHVELHTTTTPHSSPLKLNWAKTKNKNWTWHLSQKSPANKENAMGPNSTPRTVAFRIWISSAATRRAAGTPSGEDPGSSYMLPAWRARCRRGPWLQLAVFPAASRRPPTRCRFIVCVRRWPGL